MYNRDVRVIYDAHALLPQPDAVIGLLVIGRREIFVETSDLKKQAAPRQQKSARAIVDVPFEHESFRQRELSPAIAKARAISPDDAAGLLQRAVLQNDPAAYGADIVRRIKCSEGRGYTVRLGLRIIVQQQDVFAARHARSLIH